MKKLITLLSLLLLLTFCSAIAVIAPVVYVATLSITAFLANTIITIAIFIAAKSFSSKNELGKGLTQKVSFFLEIIGKTSLLIVSTTLAILIVNPILISEAIFTGIVAAVICAIILFFYNYKKFSIKNTEIKKKIIKTTAIFCIFVFISSTLVGYYSIETKVILLDGQGVNQQKVTQTNAPLADIANGFIANQSQSASAPIQGMQKESENAPQLLVFTPINLNECIISSNEKTISIKPQNNCFSEVNGFQERVICPIVLNESEFTSGSKLNSSGSCSETYTIQ